MGFIKAYKTWEKKKANSDFKRIRISSSGSFHMVSKDLFENSNEVNIYVQTLRASLKHRTTATSQEKAKV